MTFEWEAALRSLPDPEPSAATTGRVMARLRVADLGAPRVAAEPGAQVAAVDWRAWSVALGIATVVTAYGARLLEGTLSYGLLSPRLPGWLQGPAGWFEAGYLGLLLAVGLALYLPAIIWPRHGHQPTTAEDVT